MSGYDWMGKKPEPKPDPVTTELSAKNAELSAKVDALNAQLTSMRMGGTAPQMPQRPAVRTDFDASNLPDPDDKEAYAKEIYNRATQALEGRQAVQRWTEDRKGMAEKQAQALLDGFKKKFPDMKLSKRVLAGYIEDVAEDVQAEGMDPVKFITIAREDLYQRVVDKAKNDGFKEVLPEQAAAPIPDSPIRTGGLPGGSESGGRVDPGAGKSEPENPYDNPLNAWRQQHGFY